jgi:peptidoglycan/LPS O-acetylase OafA/YrhL
VSTAATAPAISDVARTQRLPVLTGGRAVAALVVFANHAGLESVFRADTVNFLLAGLTIGPGEACLSYFFMLSGFVLTWSARPGDRPARFYRRRAAKILPNHVVTWTAGLTLMWLAGTRFTAGQVLPSLGLVQAWFPSVPVLEGTDGPSWSLGCEAVFYLLFPLVVWATGRIRPDRLWRWAIGLIAIGWLVPVFALLLPYQPTLFGLPLPFYRFWFIIFLPPVRLPDFVLGVIVARLVITGRWRRVRGRTIAVLGVLGWVLSLAVPVPLGFLAPFVLPVALLLGNGAAADASGRPTVLSGRRMVRLGELSFAFYLIHWLVLHYTHAALGGGAWAAPAAVAFLLGAFAVSTGLAWLLFRLVELPAYRRWSAPRTKAGQ